MDAFPLLAHLAGDTVALWRPLKCPRSGPESTWELPGKAGSGRELRYLVEGYTRKLPGSRMWNATTGPARAALVPSRTLRTRVTGAGILFSGGALAAAGLCALGSLLCKVATAYT